MSSHHQILAGEWSTSSILQVHYFHRTAVWWWPHTLTHSACVSHAEPVKGLSQSLCCEVMTGLSTFNHRSPLDIVLQSATGAEPPQHRQHSGTSPAQRWNTPRKNTCIVSIWKTIMQNCTEHRAGQQYIYYIQKTLLIYIIYIYIYIYIYIR